MKKLKRSLIFLAVLVLAFPFLPARAEKNTGVVRVLLTRLNLADRLEITLDGSYTLNGLSFQRGSRLTAQLADGTIFVYYEGMAFDAGKELTLVRHAVNGGKENGLRFSGGYELHPGDLVLSVRDGKLRAVLHAPVEEYLLGVVPYEMSDSYPLEALKAQAVAARTYVLRRADANKKQDYDVVDNTNDQAYYGVKKEHDNAAKAVRETAGLCGIYKGSLADCYYSASNGGQTELPSHVWSKGNDGCFAMTDDPYDLENKESVVKSAFFPKSMVSNEELGGLKDTILSLLSESVEALGYDGDMEQIRVTGVENAEVSSPMFQDSPSKVMTLLRLSLRVSARRLVEPDDEEDISIFSYPIVTTPEPRKTEKKEVWSDPQPLPQALTVSLDLFPLVEKALGLSINAGSNEIMSVRETDKGFFLESRRYGHGVGMSQRGAQRMAGAYQWTYRQILRFYYPGMELKKTEYSFTMPPAVASRFLSTPAPAASPTPRPTLMPVSATPGPGQYLVRVSNIGVNSYLNLREQPNTQATVLRQLYFGQDLLVIKELGEWLMVRTDDAEGYVMEQFVSKVSDK